MRFATRAQRRREQLDIGFRPEWRAVVQHWLRHWAALSADRRERLEDLTLDLIVNKRWEAANRFQLTDEMQVIIASHAALVILGLDDDSYRRVKTIVVHPTTVVMKGESAVARGIVTRDPRQLAGMARVEGEVVLAWDSVVRDVQRPGNGHNVVFHEFAHQLDMLDGTVDGTPPLDSPAELARWVQVCTAIYDGIARGEGSSVLRTYASVNPGEFFAVATEAFFDQPVELRAEHPDLYAILADYFHQDPAQYAT